MERLQSAMSASARMASLLRWKQILLSFACLIHVCSPNRHLEPTLLAPETAEIINPPLKRKCTSSGEVSLRNGECVFCEAQGLNCSGEENQAASAPPLQGFARVDFNAEKAFLCLPPSERCKPAANAPDNSQLGCAPEYTAPLCVACREKHFASGKLCKPCTSAASVSAVSVSVLGTVVGLLLAVLVGVCVWKFRAQNAAPEVTQEVRAFGAAKHLLLLQAPVLLQTVQLWCLLGGLTGAKDPDGTSTGPWELSYLQTLLLTAQDLRSLLKVECHMNGTFARNMFTIASPVLPLCLLLCCILVDFVRPSVGVGFALKIISVFFIGGAFSCYQLTACQRVDGVGEFLPSADSFYVHFPHVKCHSNMNTGNEKHLEVIIFRVFCFTALAYSAVIPGFLMRMMARQYVALQDSQLAVVQVTSKEHTRILRMKRLGHAPLSKDKFEAPMKKQLVAAAASHMVIHMGGRVQVKLHEDAISITSLQEVEDTRIPGQLRSPSGWLLPQKNLTLTST